MRDRSKAYMESANYRVWLRDNYGLPIKEVLVL
jgi:hypothetical protein